MIRQTAFAAPGNWFRGNLHTHTTASDGKRTPQEAVDFYHQNGYDFVGLTDHMVFADIDDLHHSEDFLVLPGIEVHGVDPISNMYHLVGVGGQMNPGCRLESLHSFEEDVRRLVDSGAIVHFAHPYWSGQLPHHLIDIQGVSGVEVYNGVCDIGYAKGFSNQSWDALLTAGKKTCGLAVDDAHWVPWRKDAGLGWIMLRAARLERTAVLESLKNGSYYSTLGPAIHDFFVEGDEAVIACSPAVTINAIGERWFCNSARASTAMGLTEARLKLWEGQTYVRAEVIDRFGKIAWSNPIYLVQPVASGQEYDE